MSPFVALYSAIVEVVNKLGIPTYSASQDVDRKKLPFCRVQLINGNSTNQFSNARQYNYPFQLDMVTGQDELVKGLSAAYQIMEALRKLQVDGWLVQLASEPSLQSLVDTSTNRTLNRQIITVNYNIIEDTAF